MEKQKWKQKWGKITWEKMKLDLQLSIILIALLGMGTSFIFSASSVEAEKVYHNSMYFFDRQLLYLFLGLVAMVVVAKIRYQSLRGYIPLLNVMTLFFNILLFIPFFARTVNGATRWVDFFGITFQPSELAKITLILTLGHIIDVKKRLGKLNDFKQGIVPIALYAGILVGFVIVQKHLSASGVLIFVTGSMVLLAGLNRIYIISAASAVAAFAVIAVIAEPFRMKRMFSFLDPYQDALGSGFHVIQSWYALAGGGFFGLGLGMSRQKFQWLPENHTDFILAIVGEELGFFGIALVIGLFLWFLYRGLQIAYNAPDFYGTLVAFGIVAMLFFQVAINISVVTGLFPVTGMVLPFISYGGTSTIMLMGSVGILFNIASQQKKEINLGEK